MSFGEGFTVSIISSSNIPNFTTDVLAIVSASGPSGIAYVTTSGSNLAGNGQITNPLYLSDGITVLDVHTNNLSATGQLTASTVLATDSLTVVNSSFSTNITGTNITASNNLSSNSITASNISVNNAISSSSVTGSFFGNGNLITNLTASNINNFSTDVRTQFTAGQNISISAGNISTINVPTNDQVTSSFSVVTAKNSLTASTAQSLNNIPVFSGTPSAGQILQFNGTTWIAGAPPNGGSGGGGLLFYLNPSFSPMSPTGSLSSSVKQLGKTSQITPVEITNTISPGGSYQTVGSFVTDVGVPDVTVVPAGIWDFNVWMRTNTIVSTNIQFKLTIYQYTTSSTLILLGQSDDIYVTEDDLLHQYICSVTTQQATINLTDRIYVEILAKNNASESYDLTISYGDGTPSHIHSTLPSVGGTGIIHVINGVIQSPATPIDFSAGSSEITGVLPVINGGTNLTTAPSGSLIIGNGTTWTTVNTSSLPVSSSNITNFTNDVRAQFIAGQNIGIAGGVIAFTGTLPIANGGTGLNTIGATGNILISNGSALNYHTMSQDVTMTSAGVATVKGLQNVPVTSAAPTSGYYLKYGGTNWFAAPVAATVPVGTLQLSADPVQNITANNQTILPTTSLHRLNPSGNFNAPASNPINFGGVTLGQLLLLTVPVGNAFGVTFTKGVGLSLGANSRKISGGGSMQLFYDGTQWVEMFFNGATSV